jgi:hypothetical protein
VRWVVIDVIAGGTFDVDMLLAADNAPSNVVDARAKK